MTTLHRRLDLSLDSSHELDISVGKEVLAAGELQIKKPTPFIGSLGSKD